MMRLERHVFRTVNIIIADDRYLLRLNKVFLGKRKATNVISFDMDDVCEVYVSLGQAQNKRELYYYIVHGLLHIVGFDHRNRKEEKLMEKKCLQYLDIAGIST